MQTTFDIALQLINKIQTTQQTSIKAAAMMIGEAFINGHKFFVTGTGHSHTVAEELYGRAGGLAFTVPILQNELTLTDHPTKSTHLERLPGYASILANLYGIAKGDVILIASNSGRNAFPVEMALYAKEQGAKVIALTSIKHSSLVTSRHSSGKKLMEIADVVIDNCGEPGDAATVINGVKTPMLPTSSIANSVICGDLTLEIANYLVSKQVEVPVFCSANIDGGELYNDLYFKQYTRLF